MSKSLLIEATERQGTLVSCQGRSFRIEGTSHRAIFRKGSEGLVHRAADLSSNGPCRIKCFFDPTDLRRKRSEMLVKEQLADRSKTIADALAGAPYEILNDLGPCTPFAIVMKDVPGYSWQDFRDNGLERSEKERHYPPANWPTLKVRGTWAYGLATAVLNMERRRFIHADLSRGNVMVTPAGPSQGDMALVDFDAFVHPAFPELDTTCKGSKGYAAPEIWRSQSVDVGSDRVGMAILIQEFLVTGDPTVSIDEGFGWHYDQEGEICSLRGDPHPLLAAKYPEVAKLLTATLRARTPAARPSPDAWRPLLRTIVVGVRRSKLINVALEAYPLSRSGWRLDMSDGQKTLDLSKTQYRIGATLERNPDGSLDAVVHSGATVKVFLSDAGRWDEHLGSTRIAIRPGLVLFDPAGKSSAKISGAELPPSGSR